MDIIALAAAALKPISDEGISVQQGWYDKKIKDKHITLWSLGDYEGAHSDDGVEVDCASIQVNIWSNKDQIRLKARVKHLMKKAGFNYMGGNDELETDTKIFINAMRFIMTQEAESEEDNG